MTGHLVAEKLTRIETYPAVAPLVLRAHKVRADRITAGVVFARKLDAKSGIVRAVSDPLPESVLAEQIGEEDVKTDELAVDVLYADEIVAKSVTILEARVLELKIKEVGGTEE